MDKPRKRAVLLDMRDAARKSDLNRYARNDLSHEARAKMRLAEEYDAAQPEETKKGGRPKTVVDDNAFPTAAQIGLRRDEIHEARQFRDSFP